MSEKRFFKCPYCGDENEKTNLLIDKENGKYVRAFICNNCHRDFHDDFVTFNSDEEINKVTEACGWLPSAISSWLVAVGAIG